MATQTLYIPPAVRAALQRGEMIEAIRLLRDDSGLGLRDARKAIEALQRSGGDIASMEIGRDGSDAGTAGGRTPESQLPPEVAMALAQGNVIEAIKRLRALQPMTLHDAKAVVDRHRKAAGPSHSPTVAAGDSGGGLWWWIGLVLIAIAVWVWWSGRG